MEGTPANEQIASPRRAPSQQRSRERVERMLAAASALITEQGSDAMRMGEVAERAGVSIGSLYQFFPNREALVEALANQYLADWQRMRADTTRSRPRGLRASIGAGIDARVKFHLDHAALSRLLETNTSTARAIRELQTELGSAVAFLSSYGPDVDETTLQLYARTVNAMVNGVMNTIVYGTLSAAQRGALIDELKSVVYVYVEKRLRR